MYRKAHGAAINPVMAGDIETSKGSKIDTDGRYLDNGLELLKEAVPKLARVAFLYDPARVDIRRMKEVQTTAPSVGTAVTCWEVQGAEGFETVFAGITKERPDGLQVGGGGPLIFANQKTDRGICVKESAAVAAQQQRSCTCRWAHVLRGGYCGQLPAGRHLRGQNSEGCQARRTSCGAADEV
jgi:hypothetical protein